MLSKPFLSVERQQDDTRRFLYPVETSIMAAAVKAGGCDLHPRCRAIYVSIIYRAERPTFRIVTGFAPKDDRSGGRDVPRTSVASR